MPENTTKSERHGCIVCGRQYQLYVLYDPAGKFLASKVMTAGGAPVAEVTRPLVACETHTTEEIKRAVRRVFGDQTPEED